MQYRLATVVVILAACDAPTTPAEELRIQPVCVDPDEDVPEAVWSCEEPLVIDCHDDVPGEIHVQLDAGSCEDVELQPVDGEFPPGEHEVAVADDDGEVVCSTTLTVTDAVAPVVTTRTVELWPPNHEMHAIDLHACIEHVEDCDDEWTAEVSRVTSDEPDDATGDGRTSGDIAILDPGVVELRAERQGGGNGRVYDIAFVVRDGSGNETTAECEVVVAHDQGKKQAIDDGDAVIVDP